uniref:Acid trehalase-like protein 1 n=1 Tax=Neovison vison TaxID=452646 RepID=A0A8C7AC19_NEOVI
MPPDEYHSGVNNSVYTNVLVQNSLRFAAALAQDLGQPVPSEWLVVADKIKVPFDPRQNFHPEFDGYQPGEEVKQADVVLLGYPVPFHLSPDIRRKNLEIYEAVTSPRGPAMTWSMFAVGWMELKDPWRARDLLERCFAHIAEPFKVWTENADGSGAVNFLTGMGGFLQAALFGFTGFRITSAGVTFDPICLAGVSGVCIYGLSYQGNKLDFSFSKGCVTVEVKARAGPWAPPLEAELWPAHTRLPLLPGRRRPDAPRGAEQVNHQGEGNPSHVPPLRVPSSPCRAQSLLSLLSWTDTKVSPRGSKFCSKSFLVELLKMLGTGPEPTGTPWDAAGSSLPTLAPSWVVGPAPEQPGLRGCLLGPRIWPPSVGPPSRLQPAPTSGPADPLPATHSPPGSQAQRLIGKSEFIGPKLRVVRL